MSNGDKNGVVTLGTFEKKLWNVKDDVDKRDDKLNRRIDKYADKSDRLDGSINEIKISIARILTYQENEKLNSKRILDLLTDRIKANEDDNKEVKKRITFFSGAAAALAFTATYIWDVLKSN